jgi:hypothetical protein
MERAKETTLRSIHPGRSSEQSERNQSAIRAQSERNQHAIHLAIDPSRPEQRRIDQLGPIRSREHEDPLERFHTWGEQRGTREATVSACMQARMRIEHADALERVHSGAAVSACMQTPSSASTHRPGHRGAD